MSLFEFIKNLRQSYRTHKYRREMMILSGLSDLEKWAKEHDINLRTDQLWALDGSRGLGKTYGRIVRVAKEYWSSEGEGIFLVRYQTRISGLMFEFKKIFGNKISCQGTKIILPGGFTIIFKSIGLSDKQILGRITKLKTAIVATDLDVNL